MRQEIKRNGERKGDKGRGRQEKKEGKRVGSEGEEGEINQERIKGRKEEDLEGDRKTLDGRKRRSKEGKGGDDMIKSCRQKRMKKRGRVRVIEGDKDMKQELK